MKKNILISLFLLVLIFLGGETLYKIQNKVLAWTIPPSTSTPTPTLPPTPTPTPIDCNSTCRNANSGYINGYPLPSDGTCGPANPPPDACNSYGIVNGCCCVPCPDDVPCCFCNNGGTQAQINCSANKVIANCCPDVLKSTNVNISDPTVDFKCDCGPDLCGKNDGCIVSLDPSGALRNCRGSLCISVCDPECPNGNICALAKHEVGHYYDCCIQGIVDVCRKIVNHIKINHGAYEYCKSLQSQNKPECGVIDCNDDLARLQNDCFEYCKQNCPFSNDAHTICGQHGFSCPCPQNGPQTASSCSATFGCAGYDATNQQCTLCPSGDNRCSNNSDCVSGYFCKTYQPSGAQCCASSSSPPSGASILAPNLIPESTEEPSTIPVPQEEITDPTIELPMP